MVRRQHSLIPLKQQWTTCRRMMTAVPQQWYHTVDSATSLQDTFPQQYHSTLDEPHSYKRIAIIQSRTFATNSPKVQNKPNHKPSEAGRIVLHQENIKKLKPGQVKLCTGCGTEVRRASSKNDNQISSHQIISGVEANKGLELSKKQSKKARYADAVDMDKGAFLCDRCKALKSENIFRAYDALADVSPEVFANQLQHIVGRRRYGLCIVVVDSTDPEHSAVKNLRKMIGKKTPVWLVMNKIDLVPKMDSRAFRMLTTRISSIMDLNTVHNSFRVSSITGSGIFDLAERLLLTLGGKDVFIVGCANVGKSTLVHRLAGTIATAAYLKGRRGQTRRDLCNNLPITGSHLPGTTLQAVRIPCFSSDRHALWDTPGIINRKAIQYSLFPVHIMEPMARPEVIPLPNKEAGTQGHWRNGYSVLIEAAWMDSDEDKNSNSILDPVGDRRSIGEKMIDSISEDIVVSDDEYDDGESSEDSDEDSKEMELRLKDEKAMSMDEEDQGGVEHEEPEEKLEKSMNVANSENDTSGNETVDDKNATSGDVDTIQSRKRKAAYEKKMAIIAAAKERRRLKELQENSDGSDETEGTKQSTKDTKPKNASNNMRRGPCVLGRIDLLNVENGDSVYAQAFLHPSLRIRIVPTDEAPDHATVPSHYLATVRRRMEEASGKRGAVATKLKQSYSIPLKAFLANTGNGEVIPGDKEYNEAYDSYYMDVVFASLGWIAISHRGKFTVVPHCVEGSVYSKRPSIYPTNIATRIQNNEVYEDLGSFADLSEEEAMERLRDAAKQGRHAGGSSNPTDIPYHRGRGGGGHEDLFDYQSDFANSGDDEWY